MKIRELHFTTDAFVMVRGENKRRLEASDKLSMELDVATASVRIDDRNPGGLGVCHIPLVCVRCWFPVIEAAPQKKAANQ